MTVNYYKPSLLVPSQLPEFIRDNPDYSNFVVFLQAYYEWMEQTGQVIDRSKNLLNYDDIDKTTSEFMDYFTNVFLPYFPKDVLVDEAKAVKLARQLYQSKGTPASYAFLFKVLYNSDFDIFYTKDAVLRASDGVWYIAKSLKINSTDEKWLQINNLLLFGETTKSLATVENSVVAEDKTEIFISNIQRLFQSGEFVRVVDNKYQDVLFDGEPLRGKIVGQLSQITVNPARRGLLYQVGDPVIVYGGLSSNTGIGATAEVTETTTGSLKSISVTEGGHGYTAYGATPPNTKIIFSNLNEGAATPRAVVASIDPDQVANVVLVASDSIELKAQIPIGNAYYNFAANLSANIDCSLANAFTFASFQTGPITSVIVTNSGGGISSVPEVGAMSLYPTDILSGSDLKNLGILAKIQIVDGGTGYQNNDTIVFTGGTGYGAYANVVSVNATGSIQSIEYYTTSNTYSRGGMGYRPEYLPTVTVNSANANSYGAILSVPGILGDGAEFDVTVDRAGSITKIGLIEYGEDYVATPNVSLKIQDIVVSNVFLGNLPERNETVYQGPNANNTSYQSKYDSISLISADADPTKSLYRLRVYNYTSSPNTQLKLTVQDKNINFVMANVAYIAPGFTSSVYNRFGVRTYGDGNAKANASFLNGLVLGQGEWLNSQGRLDSFSKLQNEDYNNYTYQITVQKEIAKYREVLLELLHPTGMKLIGRYSNVDMEDFYFHPQSALSNGTNIFYHTGVAATSASLVGGSFINRSNNIIKFENLGIGVNLANIFFVNTSILSLSTTEGLNVSSLVIGVDANSNTVTLADNTWTTFGNVAYVTANSGSNVINITSLTGKYDIINNGKYSNTAYPLKDIVYVGDTVRINVNTDVVITGVNYSLNRLYVANNFTENVNSLMSVTRTTTYGGTSPKVDQIKIFGPVGFQYIPELVTESGDTIITEDGSVLLLG